jgi:hypothetical protein
MREPNMTGASADRRARQMRLVAVLLAGLGLLWLAATSLAFDGERSAGSVEIPGEREVWGYDYKAYLNAAERLVDDGSLYQDETLAGPYRPGPFGLYMYSPTLGISLLPAVGSDFDVSAMAWYWIHVLALAAACALMPVPLTIRLLTFAVAAFSYAVTRDLILGNVSVLLLVPLATAWRWLDQPLGSVAQALAMSVRPTLGVLLIWQLLRRRFVAVAWTLGAGFVLIALTLPFVGLDGYLDYLTVLRNLSRATGVPYNYDLGSTLFELGANEAVASLALLAGYALAVAAIGISLRRDRELGFIVTTSASLLLSPLLWDHYLAMLLLPAAFLASRGRPWALALPLLSWLPPVALPALAIAGTVLPFLARDRRP